MRDVVIGLVTGACLLLGIACGPSLRLEEQSTAYFEHCHAAERDPRATPDERIACWEAWIAHWSDATSSRSRVAYAESRLRALRACKEGNIVELADDLLDDAGLGIEDAALAVRQALGD